jgi:Reverse transcriptase (RNA-dependent DNA polymerase)
MAAHTTSVRRNVHEDVLPPVPLHHSPLPSLSSTAIQPCVNGSVQQRLWLSTIALMRKEPNANLAELATIQSHITEGVSLSFLTEPTARPYINTPTVNQHEAAVRTRLHEYMQFGAVIELPSTSDLTDLRVQPLHVIIKEGKKPRLVIDLSRNLNDHLRYDSFTYSTVDDAVESSHPGCWYGKLDLSNCFLSFPLHPTVCRYFCFRFDGRLYQFTHMPFGLSTAPRVCTQLLSVVNYALARAGIRDVRYLDDFFLIGRSKTTTAQQLTLAQSIITRFGLIVNPDKTEGPSQTLSFLGVQLDSVSQTVSCTPARVSELTALLRSLRHQRVITRQHAESLIGKLSFAAKVLPGARPFMRRMLDTVGTCKSKRRSTPIHIDPGFREDVRFWLQHFSSWNGRQQWRSSRASPFVFASDASLDGFGFYLESAPTHSTVDSTAWPQHLRIGSTFSGTYSAEHAHLHQSHTQISWLELLAVVACAATYAPLLTGQSLLFYVDNATDVHIINRQATRSKALAPLLRQLYGIALQHNVSIRAQHRPGVDNILADFLSRPKLHQQRHIGQWNASHPTHVGSLSAVSLVSSEHFVNSSTSSLDTRSASTRNSRTHHVNGRFAQSAHRSASTPTRQSVSTIFVSSASSTRTLIASPA